jgi:3-hydroxybutyryl-CoA dehydrogenase
MKVTDIKKIAVIGGTGLMGHGIALACLMRSKCEVVIMSRRQETINHGLYLIKEGPFGIEKAVSRGKITREEAEQMMTRIKGVTSYEEVASDAQLVFESIPEKVDVKQECFKKIEALGLPEVKIATNTSSILISELAGVLQDKGRLIGTHWFYPSNVMPLVEVGISKLTSPETISVVIDYLRLIGKKPVMVKDSPGFFMTRFINLFLMEAMCLYDEGIASMAQIDEMVKTGLGWPMGVFELLDDTASFEAWYHAQEYMTETLGQRYAIPASARKVYKAGYSGNPLLKPGSRGGWYDFFGEKRLETGKPAKE